MNRLELLQNMQKDSPDDSFLTFAIAKEYEKLGQLDEALQHFLQLVKNDPEYVGTYYHLGKLYEQKEAFAQAFATYKAGMKVARKAGDQHALSELAGAKLNLGDDEDFPEVD
jgi:tetratricopeptide (TPR) repeat protein